MVAGSWSRQRRAGALLLLIASFAAASPASAADRKAIWGPVNHDGVSQFPVYKDLGVDIYQYPLFWELVAAQQPANPTDPNDPAYAWPAELDQAVREAGENGIRMMLRVSQTPAWANGGLPPRVPPTDPRAYADFLVAASKRYPKVRLWMVWEETIRKEVFELTGPFRLERPRAQTVTAKQKLQIRKYAELLDAGYAALKRRSKSNLVIGGSTVTIGSVVDPEPFIKNLKLANGKPPRMDLFGHNPFGSREPNLAKKQLDVGTADFSDLDTLVTWIDRDLARAGRNRGLKVYISEYTAPTDVPSRQWNYHVTRATQAKWLKSAMRISRNFNRIYALAWFTLRDPDPAVDSNSGRNGLIDLQGRKKPAYYTYKRG